MNRTYLAAVAVISMMVSACATQGPGSSTATQAPVREVPSLKVVADCGMCQVRDSVPGLIAEGYRTAAAEAGAKLTEGHEITVTIQKYEARGDGARFMMGAFAGKDEIRASVDLHGKKFVVEDYYRNAWMGIEDLAKKIGGMVFEQISQGGQ